MAGTGHPWKERVQALDPEVDIEAKANSTNIQHNGMSVIWASSQGGCGPLKQLLKNVEETVPPSPTKPQSPLFSAFSEASTSRGASPFQGLSQSSASSSTSRSSSTGASLRTASASSSRVPRRTRSTLASTSDNLKGPSTGGVMKSGGTSNTSQISTVLSRVSRSLNERAMSEYNLSQNLRMQQSQIVKDRRIPSQGKTELYRASQNGTVAPSASSASPAPFFGSSSSQARPGNPPSASTAYVSRNVTAIKDSPRKGRIKALLETIDHSEPFPVHPPPTAPLMPRASSKQPSSNAPPSNSHTFHDKTSHPITQKPLALGMRRPVLQPALPNTSSQLHSASTIFKPPLSQQTSSSSPRTENMSVAPTNEGGAARPANMIDTDQDGDQCNRDIGAGTRGSSTQSQNPTRGYRTSSSIAGSLTTAGEDMDMKEDLEDSSFPEFGPVTSATYTHTAETDLGDDVGEENEAHMSDGASSGNSSYGDMDIDLAALEEACKVYDT